MQTHKNIQQIMIRQYFVVIMNTNNFSMTSLPRTHSLIAWIGYFASSISAFNLAHPFQSLQHSLDTPETSTTDNSPTYHIFCSEILYSDITILITSYLQCSCVIVITSIKIKSYPYTRMHQQKIKRIMLVGQQKTGKTSIIRYLLKNRQFDPEYYPTVGVEAGIKTYQYDNGKYAVLQIWDSAGKHDLHEYVCEKFYDDFDGFVIVTDLGNQNSMKAVYYWSEKIKRVRQGQKGYILGVVANKDDLSQPEFTQANYHKMFPNIKFYGQFSLKEVPKDKNKARVEQVFQQYIRDLYGNQLPQIVVNEAAVNSGCSCTIM